MIELRVVYNFRTSEDLGLSHCTMKEVTDVEMGDWSARDTRGYGHTFTGLIVTGKEIRCAEKHRRKDLKSPYQPELSSGTSVRSSGILLPGCLVTLITDKYGTESWKISNKSEFGMFQRQLEMLIAMEKIK